MDNVIPLMDATQPEMFSSLALISHESFNSAFKALLKGNLLLKGKSVGEGGTTSPVLLLCIKAGFGSMNSSTLKRNARVESEQPQPKNREKKKRAATDFVFLVTFFLQRETCDL